MADDGRRAGLPGHAALAHVAARGAAGLAGARADRVPRGRGRALVNGAVGVVWAPRGQPRVVFGFTITRRKIVEIDLVADAERLRQLDLAILNN